MKKLILLFGGLFFISNICLSLEDKLGNFLGNKLRQINQNNPGKDFKKFILSNNKKTTKKIAVGYFCYILDTYKNNIYTGSFGNFDPSKSIFLRLLCKETGIYNNGQFAQKIKLNPTFINQIKQIGKGNLRGPFSECKLQGYNTIPNSLNTINFSCISKKLFDLLAADIINLMSSKAYGYSKKENINQWQLSFFGKTICKDGKYLNSKNINKPSLCIHPLTLKYVKKVSRQFKSLIKNLQIIKIENLDINSFLKDLGYNTEKLKEVPTLQLLLDQIYNELYFFNLFLTYYSSFLENKTNKAELIKVGTNIPNIIDYNTNIQTTEANTYKNLSQVVILKSIYIIKNIYRTFPLHVGFLAIMEDIDAFRHALAKIYTPIDQLRYKLENVQDLDK